MEGTVLFGVGSWKMRDKRDDLTLKNPHKSDIARKSDYKKGPDENYNNKMIRFRPIKYK